MFIYKMKNQICIRLKDGKILIARKGKPFFPEPLDRDVMIIEENEEGFLVGPYPENNVMIMPFDKYQRMYLEIKNNCPSANNWRITALVFIGMFCVLSVVHLHHLTYFKDLLTHIRMRFGIKR